MACLFVAFPLLAALPQLPHKTKTQLAQSNELAAAAAAADSRYAS
jgi:hypothetical protein